MLYFPGARVDPYSYLYPLADLAAAGTTVVIVDPLFNMALIDARGVSELTADFPDITNWVLAGHSLGGVKACLEASHPSVTQLVLFASYCANDISDLDIPVLHVVGDRDGLLDDSLRRDAESLLPPGRHTTVTLQGANHADFGTYGPQPGDGESTVTDQVMRTMITDALDAHMSRD
jgi:pimeloyl-ACP methyl ester carboxylesterase